MDNEVILFIIESLKKKLGSTGYLLVNRAEIAVPVLKMKVSSITPATEW